MTGWTGGHTGYTTSQEMMIDEDNTIYWQHYEENDDYRKNSPIFAHSPVLSDQPGVVEGGDGLVVGLVLGGQLSSSSPSLQSSVPSQRALLGMFKFTN